MPRIPDAINRHRDERREDFVGAASVSPLQPNICSRR